MCLKRKNDFSIDELIENCVRLFFLKVIDCCDLPGALLDAGNMISNSRTMIQDLFYSILSMWAIRRQFAVGITNILNIASALY